MRGLLRVFALLGGIGMALPGQAAADLRDGQTKFLHGDYKGARSALAAVEGADRGRARLTLARLDMRVGEYANAETVLGKLVKSNETELSLKAHAAFGELLNLTGRHAQARKLLEPMAAKHGDNLEIRYQLGKTYQNLAALESARKTFEQFIALEQAGKLDLKDAEQLFYVAEAGKSLNHFEYANDTYRDAVHANPKFLAANIAWANLFLEKYSAGPAEQSFDEVLKIDPHHPDAHAGMARVKLEQNYDIGAAQHHLELALATNPRHVPSLLVRAGIEIDQNRWEQAKASVAAALAVNPKSFEGRALLATVHWLRDDSKAYETTRDAVLKDNPAYAEFFHIVARSAVREHRYKEAIELEKQAVKVNPEYFEAMQAIGTGYLRLGEESLGLDWLNKSWEGDRYNVRTYNSRELFGEDIPREYKFSRSKSFKWRFHTDEQTILKRYLEPTLEAALEGMIKRYGFRPKLPIVMELYRSLDQFSVRTVGLPNLGALGVCFGQVITAISPSGSDLNWSMVLWHELAHVFAIQMSNSRVPRWFTEGLSEYETLIARPEWRRENDSDLWAALRDNALPSVADLNHSFMTPNMQDVVVAYHLSSVTIEYIATTYGFPRIVKALRLYGQGKETPEVIREITGRTIAEFDAEFRKYIELRLKPYRGSFTLPSKGLDDITKLEIATAAAPKQADSWARLALGQFYQGNAEEAEKAARKAIELSKSNRIALYVLAELAMRQRKLPEAKLLYERLIRARGDNYDVRSRLGLIAASTGDMVEAEKHLCTAKTLDPERSYPYQALAELYTKRGKIAEALTELETYVMIEQMEYAPAKRLVTEYAKQKNWPKVRRYGELALNINPFDATLYLSLAEAYLNTGDNAKALFTYESALLVRPELRRPALAHIGRARALVGKKNEALAELKRALQFEPDNVEALELRKKLRAK